MSGYTPARRRRVLLVAATTGYQTRMFDAAAQRLGLELVMATDRCHVLDNPWGDDAVPLRFEQPEAAAVTLARLEPRPAGIAAVGDRPALIAALAAREIGLRFSPPEAVAASKNKNESRRRFAASGLPVPDFFRVPVASDPREASGRAPYPCVLKPLGLSASRGVIRADTPDEFTAAFHRIRQVLASPDIVRLHDEEDRYIQVESYVPGREFAVEGILTQCRMQVHAVFDKPDDLSGPFFEESIYVTPSREAEPVQRRLLAATERAIAALGLTDGPFHAELRLNADAVYVLEVAARPIGGLCAKALRFSGGTSLEELVLMHAIGEDVSGLHREAAASAVMMVPIPQDGFYQSVSGIEDAGAVPFVEEIEITAREGQKLRRLPEGNAYLGFIFARAEQPEDAEHALREAHARLRFEIAAELPVLQRV